jgi:pimeloyl-ACP methyl ester carboxylesterase
MKPEQRDIQLAHGKVNVLIGGTGPNLLVLHRDTGRHGWNRLHERLAATHRVIAPALPGYDESERPVFLRNVTDLAALTGQMLDRLDATPCAILGLGFGGWVAAEMAAHGPQRVTRLVLQSPMGVKPREGHIADQFLFEPENYMRLGFSSVAAHEKAFPGGDAPHIEGWDRNREMTTRIAYKPYMFDLALPHLLRNAKVPALVVWCGGDAIVPRSCAEIYAESIAGSRLVEMPGVGHRAELEAPDALAELVIAELKAAPAARAAAQ